MEPSPDLESDHGEEEVWWSWRVRLKDIDELIRGLEALAALSCYCNDRFLNAEGVLDVEDAKEAYVTGWKSESHL